MLGAVTQIPVRIDSCVKTVACDHSSDKRMAELFQHTGGGVKELRLGVGVLCVYIQGMQSLVV